MADPTKHGPYRCRNCGNKTRFDVFTTEKVRRFYHFTLGGEHGIEELEILSEKLDSVVCRMCGAREAEQADENGEYPSLLNGNHHPDLSTT